MSDIKFKVGDKVRCSCFVYEEDNRYIGVVGVFDRYNRYDDGISYVNFRQSPMVSCFTSYTELLATKNEQLLFDFMY